MRIFLRCMADHRPHWRVCVALVLLAILVPPVSAATPLVQKHLVDDVILARRVDMLPSTAALYAFVWLMSTTLLTIAGLLRPYLAEQFSRSQKAGDREQG